MENSNQESVYPKISSTFRHDVIKESLKLHFGNKKTKITEDAVEVMKEVVKALAVEATVRSARQAKIENKSCITVNHVENMLLQLMLDFP